MIFVGVLKVTDEKSRIRIRTKMSRTGTPVGFFVIRKPQQWPQVPYLRFTKFFLQRKKLWHWLKFILEYWNILVVCSDGRLEMNSLCLGLVFPQLTGLHSFKLLSWTGGYVINRTRVSGWYFINNWKNLREIQYWSDKAEKMNGLLPMARENPKKIPPSPTSGSVIQVCKGSLRGSEYRLFNMVEPYCQSSAFSKFLSLFVLACSCLLSNYR